MFDIHFPKQYVRSRFNYKNLQSDRLIRTFKNQCSPRRASKIVRAVQVYGEHIFAQVRPAIFSREEKIGTEIQNNHYVHFFIPQRDVRFLKVLLKIFDLFGIFNIKLPHFGPTEILQRRRVPEPLAELFSQ